MISNILEAVMATCAWLGCLVLWLLMRTQKDHGAYMLRRYTGLKFLAWSILIATETLSYIRDDASVLQQQLTWISGIGITDLSLLAFRATMALATWILIRDLLHPRTVSTGPTPHAQIRIDVDGIIKEWNEAATAMFGWTEQEMLGHELAADSIIPELYRGAHRAGLAHYRATGKAPFLNKTFTQQALCKDKPSIVVDINLTADLTPEGTLFRAIITLAKTPLSVT